MVATNSEDCGIGFASSVSVLTSVGGNAGAAPGAGCPSPPRQASDATANRNRGIVSRDMRHTSEREAGDLEYSAKEPELQGSHAHFVVLCVQLVFSFGNDDAPTRIIHTLVAQYQI